MKKVCLALMVAFSVATFTSCSKSNIDDGFDPGTKAEKEEIVVGEITTDTHWTADKQWIIDGIVKVKNGSTLTIDKGTIIKGKYGTKATLAVLRGSKIMAQGTAAQPIVFTSDRPAGSRKAGDWGGVILCGKAPHNLFDPANPDALKPEGGIIDSEIAFGGTDADDNSGVMKYCRIEFAGYVFQEGNEINGFTFCSVGRGTTISHIQVSYANDDAFEWFGGTVNCTNLVSYAALDDDFDTDNGFSGTIQYGVILRSPDASDISNSNGFESDNNANGDAKTPNTSAVFTNFSAFGPLATVSTLPTTSKHQFGFQIRRNSSISIFNSVFAGFAKGMVIDTDKKPSGTNGSHDQATAGNLVINNVVIAGSNGDWNTWFEKSGTAAADTTFSKNYFTEASRNNAKFATFAEIKVKVGSLTTPNFLPQAGSYLLNKASYSHAKLAKVDKSASFIGAFGTTDWTQQWCNFDPQNADYSLK